MDLKQQLTQIASRVDEKGLHSIADRLDSLLDLELLDKKLDRVNELNEQAQTFENLEEAVEFYETGLPQDLVEVADHLDSRGLGKIANEIDLLIEADLEGLEKQSVIENILGMYRDIHKMASLKGICKADIRKDNLPQLERCPFGLDIPEGCQTAGSAIYKMAPHEEHFGENRVLCDQECTGEQCPFAVNVLEEQEAVNCSWGTTTQGRETIDVYRGSPIYPKLFQGINTVNIDRNPPVDFGYDAGFYR